jgi:predicted Zn-dependent protease
VRLAGDRLGPLTALLGIAASWAPQQAREDLLWQIAQRFPRERWALSELERLYSTAGNTHGLNKVYSTMTSYAPKNFAAQNNLAATSLLLKLNLTKAHELAKEVFDQHPDQAIVTSTYAFSLHLQGRTKEGLAVLQKLKPEALETPSVALYYGLLLSATGETNQASKYLVIAKKADLLPEEKALAAEAIRQNSSGN